MPLRIIALILVVLFITGYAWKNWFNALLGAIVMFAFIQHPDMPSKIAGVPGLSFWNMMVFTIAAAWLTQRQVETDSMAFPQSVKIALLIYVAAVVISFLRAFINPTPFFIGTRLDIAIEAFLNPMKFLLPALMLYDGCRSRERVIFALAAILSVYFLLALQSIKAMGWHLELSSGAEFSARASRILGRQVGYDRVDLSMMFAGASWAIIAFSRQFDNRLLKLALWGAGGVVLLGQAFTGGRTGYVTWGLVGLILCMMKWRKLLPVIPVAVAAVIIFMPAVGERMSQGFAQQHGGIVSHTNSSEITSGRTDIWPYVVDEILKAPMIGYGRYAMMRTGLSIVAEDNVGEYLGHPHNAYLEMLLDDGVIGACCMLPLYFILLRRSFLLFLDRDDILCEVAGGVGFSLLMALFVAAIGAQTFYPREGVVGMWAALAVALRLSVQRHLAGAGEPLFETNPDEYEQEPPFAPASRTGY